jgi:hypothetical protein
VLGLPLPLFGLLLPLCGFLLPAVGLLLSVLGLLLPVLGLLLPLVGLLVLMIGLLLPVVGPHHEPTVQKMCLLPASVCPQLPARMRGGLQPFLGRASGNIRRA